MENKKRPIFISSARDDRETVDQITRFLEGKGVAVWSDQALHSGSNWKGKIEKAIKQADLYLLVVTPHFLASPWSNFEAGLALGQEIEFPGKRVIPVLLGGVRRDSLPAILRPSRAIDASGMDQQTLFHTLEEVLSDAQAAKAK